MDNPTNNPIISLINDHCRLTRRLRRTRRHLRQLEQEQANLHGRLQALEYVVSEELLCHLARPADILAEAIVERNQS